MDNVEARVKRFRKRAEQLRTIAWDVRGRSDYQVLVSIARELEQMAKCKMVKPQRARRAKVRASKDRTKD